MACIVLLCMDAQAYSAIPAGWPCNQLIKQTIHYHDALQGMTVTRPYYLFIPAYFCQQAHAASPMVIYGLHGYYGTATGFELSTTSGSLDTLAKEKHFVMVYPQGMTEHHTDLKDKSKDGFYSSWNFLPPSVYTAVHQDDVVYYHNKAYPLCNKEKMQHKNPIPQQPGCKVWNGVCSWTSCYDDPDYLLAIQNELIHELHADKSRQYLIGISNGAMMAYEMACRYPGHFQGVVAVGGSTIPKLTCPVYSPQTSVLVISGKHDLVVPLTPQLEKQAILNTYYYKYADDLVQEWTSALGCQQHINTKDSALLDGLRCSVNSQCGPQNSTIAQCTWGHNTLKTINHGHTYPGTKETNGWCVDALQHDTIKAYPVCKQIKTSAATTQATQLIYDFLTRHQLPQ